MNKEQLLALGLTEEQASKVLDGFKDSVPYGRFKEVNDEKNELKNQLSNRDEQLKELAKITKDNEELNSKVKELQETNKTAQTEYESKLANLRLDNGIELALTQSGALNNKAVKALLEMEKIKFENDKLVGFDEQIETLRGSEETAFLFTKKEEKPTFSGIEPTTSVNTKAPETNSFKSYTDILAEYNN